jgi:hypothetical protein
MPRLSVDIDLAYLPLGEPRETALKKMSHALGRIAASVTEKAFRWAHNITIIQLGFPAD